MIRYFQECSCLCCKFVYKTRTVEDERLILQLIKVNINLKKLRKQLRSRPDNYEGDFNPVSSTAIAHFFDFCLTLLRPWSGTAPGLLRQGFGISSTFLRHFTGGSSTFLRQLFDICSYRFGISSTFLRRGYIF